MKKKKSKKNKSHIKSETLKTKEENENVKKVEPAKDILKEKEAEIEKERLRLMTLNKNQNEQVKESIQEKEDKLRKLLLERRKLKRQLLEELKEKESKKVLKDEAIDKKDIVILNETIEDDEEPEFYEYVDTEKNVFKVFIGSIIYYVSKYIFRKNIKSLEYVRIARHNYKFKILFSIIITLITITALVLFMKLLSTPKDTYSGYLSNTTTTTTTTQSSAASSENTDSNENSKKDNENVNSDLIDLINKEEEAANKDYNPGITLSVARDIKVLEKIPTYQSAGWSNKIGNIEKDTQLKVNSVSFPGGYMMYQIAEGDAAGQYITANPKLVEIVTNNDSMNFDFITYPLAVAVTEEQDIFEDKELTKTKSKATLNTSYSVTGYGVSNNRLVYYLEDGTYLPFANTVVQI
ncbi:hypothetical protein IR073_01130 [Gemella sp. 19428wG2_WT2a]|nr:hypothetical protein [Gemella sp. 19428wG2_WT2a]TFU60561.1 hypothetical protein E4T67_01125 [Gemella sp. WT2a]